MVAFCLAVSTKATVEQKKTKQKICLTYKYQRNKTLQYTRIHTHKYTVIRYQICCILHETGYLIKNQSTLNLWPALDVGVFIADSDLCYWADWEENNVIRSMDLQKGDHFPITTQSPYSSLHFQTIFIQLILVFQNIFPHLSTSHTSPKWKPRPQYLYIHWNPW